MLPANVSLRSEVTNRRSGVANVPRLTVAFLLAIGDRTTHPSRFTGAAAIMTSFSLANIGVLTLIVVDRRVTS